jgi:hypothetical protein
MAAAAALTANHLRLCIGGSPSSRHASIEPRRLRPPRARMHVGRWCTVVRVVKTPPRRVDGAAWAPTSGDASLLERPHLHLPDVHVPREGPLEGRRKGAIGAMLWHRDFGFLVGAQRSPAPPTAFDPSKAPPEWGDLRLFHVKRSVNGRQLPKESKEGGHDSTPHRACPSDAEQADHPSTKRADSSSKPLLDNQPSVGGDAPSGRRESAVRNPLSSRRTLRVLSSSAVNRSVDLDVLVSVCRQFAQSWLTQRRGSRRSSADPATGPCERLARSTNFLTRSTNGRADYEDSPLSLDPLELPSTSMAPRR